MGESRASGGREWFTLAVVCLINSMAVALINVSSTLKVFELTSEASLVAAVALTYNVGLATMSKLWPRLFLGRLSRRDLIVLSMVMASLASALIAATEVPGVIVALNFIAGAAYALFSPAMTTVMVDYVGKDSLGVSKFKFISGAGIVVGYGLGSGLRALISHDLILLITSVLIISTSLLTSVFPVRYTVIEPRRVTYVSLIPSVTGRLRNLAVLIVSPKLRYNLSRFVKDILDLVRAGLRRSLPLLLVGVLTLFTSIMLFFSIYPAYLKLLGFHDSEIYLLSLTASLTSTLIYRLIYGRLDDLRLVWKALYLASLSRFVLFLTPIPLEVSPDLMRPVTYTAFVAIGISWALISTSMTLTLIKLSEPERRGERLAQLNLAISAGSILGSILGLALVEIWGFTLCFVLASLLALAASLAFYGASRALAT